MSAYKMSQVFVWNKYHENLLKSWAQMSKTYAIMHSLCAQYYATWDKRLGVPVILLGAVTSSSIFGSASDPTGTMNYINGAMALTVTALAGLTRFLGTATKQVKNQTASFKYTAVSMDIDTILSFPRAGRPSSPQEFITGIKSRLLEIRENAPDVLAWIMDDYLRKYDRTLTNVKSKVNSSPGGDPYVKAYGYGTATGPVAYDERSSEHSDRTATRGRGGPVLQARQTPLKTVVSTDKHVLSDFADRMSGDMVRAGDMLGDESEADSEDEDNREDSREVEIDEKFDLEKGRTKSVRASPTSSREGSDNGCAVA